MCEECVQGEVRFPVSNNVGTTWATMQLTLHDHDSEPDVILSGDYSDGIEVPAGETWRIDGLVTTPANVVVFGTLMMRPGSTLRFRDVDQSQFVGGHTDVPLATDVGLWVVGHGVLDVEGTPRAGWNRTGEHISWQPGDEVRVAPTVKGDFTTFAEFTPGTEVPQAYPNIPPAEVFNLTRDVVIEGTPDGRAHVMFLHCHKPQTIRWATVRHMGVPVGGVSASGRYAVHFHHCHDGSRGSLVEGVVVRDSGRGFVPHLSHGIEHRDCIAYNLDDIGYWWDPPALDSPCRVDAPQPYPSACNFSDDVVYDHCLAARIAPDSTSFSMRGFDLQAGHRNVAVDCAAVGVGGRISSAGFVWDAPANLKPNVWTFKDCVAHNNARLGIFVWQNDANPHVIDRYVAYNNGGAAINHGAYVNPYRYRDLTLVGNGGYSEPHLPQGQIVQHAHSDMNTATGSPQGWERARLDAAGVAVAAVVSERHTLPGDHPIEMVECEFDGHPVAVRLVESSGGHPAFHDFVRCTVDGVGLEPSDVQVVSNPNGCTVRGQRSDGTAWQIGPDGTVTSVPPFHEG